MERNFLEFKKALEDEYKKYFENSKIVVKASNNLYKTIYIDLYFAGDIEEVANKIWGNDLFKIMFQVETENGEFENDITDDMKMPENLVFSNVHNMVTTTPENKFMAYGSVSVPFRKVKGNTDKIIKYFDKYCANLKALLQDLKAENRIPENYMKLYYNKMFNA